MIRIRIWRGKSTPCLTSSVEDDKISDNGNDGLGLGMSSYLRILMDSGGVGKCAEFKNELRCWGEIHNRFFGG